MRGYNIKNLFIAGLVLQILPTIKTVVILNKVKPACTAVRNLNLILINWGRDSSLRSRMTIPLKFCKVNAVLISMILVISSCSIKGYKPITEFEKNTIIEPYIFSAGFEKALFKTTIDIYDNIITGLTLIKKTDSSIRVVSMSELGIKYFDIEFPFNQQIPAKVHYVMEPMNKKLLIKMIIADFNLLLFTPDTSKYTVKVDYSDNTKLLAKHKRLIYFFNSSNNITEIQRQHWPLSPKSIINLTGYKNGFPQTITIDHGKIWFEFNAIE